MNQFTIQDRLAATKAFEVKKEDAQTVKSGIYQGSFAVRVTYTMQRAEPTDAKPTSHLLSMEVLAKAIVLSGIQSDNFFEALRKVANEAIKSGEQVGVALTETDSRILAKMQELDAQVIAKLPRTPRQGATKVIATLERLDALDTTVTVNDVTSVEIKGRKVAV